MVLARITTSCNPLDGINKIKARCDAKVRNQISKTQSEAFLMFLNIISNPKMRLWMIPIPAKIMTLLFKTSDF